MSIVTLAGITGLTVGNFGLAIGAERKSSNPPGPAGDEAEVEGA